MRRPYQVGLKLRELMRRHVEDFVKDRLARRPQNCSLGNQITIEDSGQMLVLCTAPMCTKSVGSLPVCSQATCSTCPHYCPKVSSREEALVAFKETVSDPVVKRGLYPDVVALEWVLDSSYHEAVQSPSWYMKILLSAIDTLEAIARRVTKSPALLSWGKLPRVATQPKAPESGGTDEQKSI